MNIKNHPTKSDIAIIIDPTPDAVAVAKELTTKNQAKINPDGSIQIRQSSKYLFEKFMELTDSQKISDYRVRIANLRAYLAQQDENDVFGRIAIVEANREIAELEDRIERIERRMAGTPATSVTAEQVRRIEWVNSRAYDEE